MQITNTENQIKGIYSLKNLHKLKNKWKPICVYSGSLKKLEQNELEIQVYAIVIFTLFPFTAKIKVCFISSKVPLFSSKPLLKMESLEAEKQIDLKRNIQ